MYLQSYIQSVECLLGDHHNKTYQTLSRQSTNTLMRVSSHVGAMLLIVNT